jgi:uncharacterized membrane protein YesL
MRAFLTTWRSLVSFYNEMFLLVGASLFWWLGGGFFVGAAVVLGYPMLLIEGPFWLAPLIAIPAGPATAALANVTHRVARELHVDRSFFTDGLRQYWKMALGVSAVLGMVTMLLLLNVLFYASRPEPIVKGIAFLFIVLLVYGLSIQIYVFPVLVGMKEPSVIGALKMAAMMAFANPLFSLIIVIVAGLLTGLSVVLAVLVVLAWPSVLLLLGAHSLKLMVELAGGTSADGDEAADQT